MQSPTATARAPRITRRRVATRAQLVEAAARVFDETGSTNISVETICARAGYTRGAFYSNFTSVDALYLAVYEDRSAAVLAQLDELMSDQPSQDGAQQPETLAALVHHVLDALPMNHQWFSLRADVLAQATRRPEIAATLHQQGQQGQQFHRALQPLLVATLERLGREPLVDPDLFTQAVIAAYVGAVSQAVIYDDPTQIREARGAGHPAGTLRPPPGQPDELRESRRRLTSSTGQSDASWSVRRLATTQRWKATQVLAVGSEPG